MAYKPKIISGRVKGTGYPIDGHVLYFSAWDYDNGEFWHLYGWDDEDDEAVMLTMYEAEKEEANLTGLPTMKERDFKKNWKAKRWEPDAPFCLPLDAVEVVEVKQEEERDKMRDKLLAHGFDLSPRKNNDEGGILCLPLDKNLNGDTQAKHPDWKPVNCPLCGRKCWQPAGAENVSANGALCTECALEAGLVSPFRPASTTKPGGNRAERRRAKREKGRDKT